MSMAIGFSPLAATKFPTGGHRFSPLVAIRCPHWWPSNLPTGGCGRVRSGASLLCQRSLSWPVGDQDVRVMKEPFDGRGREAFGHQLVETARVNVRRDRDRSLLVGGV